MKALKIGEVAALGGGNLQTIRYYEREQLLPTPPRLASGYRMFPEQTVRRVRFIRRAQELVRNTQGLTLELGPGCMLESDGPLSAYWPCCEKNRPDCRCHPVL